MAHDLKPVVLIGQKGITGEVVRAIDEALDTHELIKVKFTDLSERNLKYGMIEEIEQKTGCFSVGMTGHVAILFRSHKDPQKRKIVLPQKESRE